MFDLAHFFTAQAWAQDAAPAAPDAGSGSASSLTSLLGPLPLLIVIFALFFFMNVRPQYKKFQEQEKMIKALKRGDRVVTSGGIYGKVTKLEDETLTLEIAEGVNIKIVRTQVQSLAAKTDTTAVANDDADDEKKNV